MTQKQFDNASSASQDSIPPARLTPALEPEKKVAGGLFSISRQRTTSSKSLMSLNLRKKSNKEPTSGSSLKSSTDSPPASLKSARSSNKPRSGSVKSSDSLNWPDVSQSTDPGEISWPDVTKSINQDSPRRTSDEGFVSDQEANPDPERQKTVKLKNRQWENLDSPLTPTSNDNNKIASSALNLLSFDRNSERSKNNPKGENKAPLLIIHRNSDNSSSEKDN
jgi:hypothetical protein